MRVALLGLGLIGGSVARALHADTGGGWSVAAWTPTGVSPRVAEDAGIIELAAGTPAAAIDGADLVVLAASPLDCLDHAPRARRAAARGPLAGRRDHATSRARRPRSSRRRRTLGLRFIGGHPMAGREASGFEAADVDAVPRPALGDRRARGAGRRGRPRSRGGAGRRLRRAGRADDGRRARPRSSPRSATCRWCCLRRSSRPSRARSASRGRTGRPPRRSRPAAGRA